MSEEPNFSNLNLSCCVTLCKNYQNTRSNTELYSLPDDSSLRKLYSDTLGIPLEVALDRRARVCALHFISKHPEIRKNNETASQSNLKPAVPAMPNFSYRSSTPIVLGNQPTYVNFPFNSNFGPPIRFFLQRPVLNTSSVPNQGIKFLSSSNNHSEKGTSILKRSVLLGSTSGAKDIVNISQETITVLPSESSNSSVKSVEEGIESELDLQCDEEQLSQAQLNAYYADLVNFISANEKITRIPVPAKTETISVQTDPVTILGSDPIPVQEPCISITESSGLQSLEEEEEISLINQFTGLSGAADASHKITQIIDRNTSLLNSVQVPPKQNDGMGASSTMSATSFLNPDSDLNNSSISTLTTPSSTLSNTYTYGDRSKLSANLQTVGYQVRPPPAYISSEKTTETVPLINQVYSQTSLDHNLLNMGQPGVSPAMQPKTYQKKIAPWPERQKARLQVFSIPSNQITGALPAYNLTSGNQPLQFLIQNQDQPNVLVSSTLSASGSTLSGSNSATSTSATNENDNDKEADLLSLCNVATVYGNDSPSQASADSDQNLDLNPVTGVLEKLKRITNSSSGNSSVTGAHKEIEPPSGTFLDSSGPLIVDVISATEGAKEYFIGDKIPNILFNRNSQKSRNEKEMYTDNLPLNKTYQASETNSSIHARKDTASSSSADKSKSADGLPPTIKLNNSVFSFQKSIPILPPGFLWVGKPHLFLTHLNLPVLRSRSAEAEVLRTRLQTEKFIPCSAWWMVRRNYLPTIFPCQCKCTTFTIHRSYRSPLFPNGFYWQCENPKCLRKESVRKPKFFEEYKHWTLEDLLLMTFHWACQTPFAEVTDEVKLSPDCILAYYTALRNLCRQVSMKKCKLGTSPSEYVEASLVKMGSYFILGAYDRNTNYIRLEVLEESQAYNSTLHIELLKTWLTDKAVLVTEQQLPEETLKGIQKKQANPNVYNMSSKEPHILNISNFLLTNLSAIFGKINVDSMSLDLVKGLLYELQWRAKYGKFLDMAFWSIMNDIRDLNDSKKGQITAKPGNLDVEAYCEKMPDALRKNWGILGPVKRKPNVTKVLFKKKISPNKKDIPKQMHPPAKIDVTYVPKPLQKAIQPAPPKNISFPSNVNYVMECSNLFQDVPFIPGGNSNINSKSLLAIKIRCEDSTPSGVYKPNATSLGLQLRTEGFISNPVKWLVKRGYLSGHNPCYVCKQTAVLKSNVKFKDGCSWSCQNEKCKFENMFKRPLFFARFNEQPMAQIAAMIFHWTVQSDYNIVVSDVPLEPVKISHAWRAFQVLCSSALKRENFKVGGEGQIVEVALVEFGKLYILGARHRITKRTLLKCFPVDRIDQINLIQQTLRNWIIPGSHVVANSTALFRLDKSYVEFKADASITDKSSTQMHVMNVTSYLQKQVFDMFGHLRASTVKAHLMQVYLDELMWRERFGKLPNLAFAKIMYEIFYYEKHNNSFLQNHHFNFSVKELIEEEPQLQGFKKEVCVVLHRIPQSVLKYYNCWPISKVHENEGTSKPLEISNSDEDSISRILSEEDFQFNDSNDSVTCSEEGKFPKRSKGKIDQMQALDESSSSSSEEEDSCFSGDGRNTSPESVSEESSDVDNLLPYTSKRRKAAVQDRTAKVIKTEPESPSKPMNSVQKLVIKMNKNSQKCQSYFKSDTVKAKYKRQRSRGLFNARRSRKKSQNKSRSKSNPSPNKLKLDAVVKQEILDDEPGPSGYCPSAESEIVGAISPRRRTAFAGKQICIECGKEIKFEHFMKRYDCTDCTKSKYSTCCRNAFFEHRSALLFGKRPPRREKVKLNYGLHRPRPLLYTVACPCGFKTKVGNEMASHMVRCQHSSCVSQS